MSTNLREHLGTGAVAVLIAVIFTAICIIPAMAEMTPPADRWHEKGKGRHKRQGAFLGMWRNPQLVQALELSENQIDQLRDADFATREKHLELKAQLDTFHLHMEKAFSDESVDENAVRQLAADIADMRGRLFVQNVESRLAAGKILSADQLGKLRLMKMQQGREGQRKGKKPVSARPSANQADAPAFSYALYK